ncbi:hypothetical protein H4219_005479 [Mycoemilia scoparia]|uniref:Carbohydrate-binding module family 96 domain-containing protein n=1 Tax=Mycoemilia scoparia TaxID=417184 RepID=A0A9W7ZUG2_9FUNG|nr:hypothetical protein H4219_005479 [Mycoemilia scoparia]
MKLIATIIATSLLLSGLASAQQQQKTYSINVSKDSTIQRSAQACNECPSNTCSLCKLGADQRVQVHQDGFGAKFGLFGFTLPSEVIQAPDRLDKCLLELKQPNTPMTAQVILPIHMSGDTFWDEYSVDGNNAPSVGAPIGQAVIPNSGAPALIDLTAACKAAAAKGAGISLYLLPRDNTILTFPSKEGGRPAVLHATIH